ncbi:MAG TPA: hypothetical protein VF723_16665, partial [Pyrinomonadaceae bacterium]
MTLNDKGLGGIVVALFSTDARTGQGGPIGRATTDFEGRYRLTRISAGRYSVAPLTPAMVGAGAGVFDEPGKPVTLAEGEVVEKIDFALRRGGVITGRVTDADGRPVIGEYVRLNTADQQQGSVRNPFALNSSINQTDDRGIYRIYGLADGRYTVSVGEATQDGTLRRGYGRRGYYRRTFHPNVTDQSKAAIIEITDGSEATGVDIVLGRKARTFTVTGRVLDAETGQPVPNIPVAHGSLTGDKRSL